MDKPNSKKIISLEMPLSMREALRLEAFKQNISISALIRKIISENLYKKEN